MSNTIAHRSGLQMKPALLCAVSLTLLGTTGCGTGRWLGLGGSESSNNAKPTGNNTPSPQLTNKEFAEFAMENANSLRQQGFYQDALRELQRAIALNPELPAAYAQAGDIYRDLGFYLIKMSRFSAISAKAESRRNFEELIILSHPPKT